IQSGALVQEAVEIDEPLCKGLWIGREDGHHPSPADRRACGGAGLSALLRRRDEDSCGKGSDGDRGEFHAYLKRSSNALRALSGGADFVSRSTVVRGSKNVHVLRWSFGQRRAAVSWLACRR